MLHIGVFKTLDDKYITFFSTLFTQCGNISYLFYSPCFRTIFEGDPDQFQERLDARIKAHDKEIERMCNYHYQGFIESVRGLLQVRGDVEKLKVPFFRQLI